ncbi:MAG: riboflavin biosynthesis protein RibF, partial [Planctomycetes bacterium]|nr:riboflavin biosynthesis protein RibF [Planctomycetota bacterium]
MEVVRWPTESDWPYERGACTLGVFDGVHLGHQKVLWRVVDEAKSRGMPAVVITFDRHPGLTLGEPGEPFITALEHRLCLFEDLGLDGCVVIEFDEEVARIGARDFARKMFGDLIEAKVVVIGFDSKFGKGGEGDIETLRNMQDELGIEVYEVPSIRVDGEVVSSTAIREAVREGDLERAERLLGRPYSMYGTVVHGAGLGHEMDCPTANLEVHHELFPKEGVYATWLHYRGNRWESVTSVGTRETIEWLAEHPPVIEVHVLGKEVD